MGDAPLIITPQIHAPIMQRFEDASEDLLRTVLKANEYARFQAKRAVRKRARLSGRRPLK